MLLEVKKKIIKILVNFAAESKFSEVSYVNFLLILRL